MTTSRFLILFSFIICTDVYSNLDFKVLGLAKKVVDTKSTVFSEFYVLKLRRGETDLVFKGDHYKFTKDKKFIFRGICLISNKYESVWLAYNTFGQKPAYAEVLKGKKTKNYLIPLRARNVRRIAGQNLAYYERQMDRKLKDKNVVVQKNDKEKIKVDDNNDIELNPNLYYVSEDKKEIKVLNKYVSDFYIGPLVINSVPGTVNVNLGASFRCLYCEKHKYFIEYRFSRRTEDPLRSQFGDNLNLISSNNHELIGHYERVKPWSSLSFYSRIYANRARTSDTVEGVDIFSPEYNIRITPLAIRFHILQNLKKQINASVGFGPSYSLEKFMFNDAGSLGIEQENKLRWSFNFYFDWKPKDWIKIVSDSWFHPVNSNDTGSFDVYDSGPSRFNLITKFIISENFSVDYRSDLIWNKLQKRREGLPSTNFINSVNMNYSVKF